MTKDELNLLVGRNIARLRRRKGWSRAELSRRSDMPISSLQGIEHGKHSPLLVNAVRITDELGCKLDDLVRWIDE